MGERLLIFDFLILQQIWRCAPRQLLLIFDTLSSNTTLILLAYSQPRDLGFRPTSAQEFPGSQELLESRSTAHGESFLRIVNSKLEKDLLSLYNGPPKWPFLQTAVIQFRSKCLISRVINRKSCEFRNSVRKTRAYQCMQLHPHRLNSSLSVDLKQFQLDQKVPAFKGKGQCYSLDL